MDICSDNIMNLKEMSNKELLELKEERYAQAEANGIFGKIATVCRYLGNRLNTRYDPKYSWEHDDINIYVDDYGHYMTMHYNGKEILSTHPCQRFIIPCEAIEKILELYPKAQVIAEEKNANTHKKEKERLLAMIA